MSSGATVRVGVLPKSSVARLTLILLVLSTVLFFGTGCASRQYAPAQIDDEAAGIERPAQPLSEEEGLADRIGQVGVVLLVVVVTVGGILIPILLL